MNENITVRRVGADEAPAYIEALADVLIDCVEGGASVSFMLPISRATAVGFWTRVAQGSRVTSASCSSPKTPKGMSWAPCRLSSINPRISRIGPMSRRCSWRGGQDGKASRND